MDRLIHIYFTDKEEKCSKISFWFDDSNLHYTHAHIVWGGQRGFEPLPNGREFSLAPLSQMPSGQCSKIFGLKRKIYILKKKIWVLLRKKKRKKNSQFTKVTDWD